MDDVTVPDVYGAITAYRWWHFTDPHDLTSSATAFNWHPGVNEAACDWGEKHHLHHTCGFWCLKSEEQLKDYRQHGPIAGQIEVWGSIVEHELGFRAEYARVTAILALHCTPRKVKQDTLSRVAEHYDVPVIGEVKLVTLGEPGYRPEPARKKKKLGTRVKMKDGSFEGEVIKSSRFWTTIRLDNNSMRKLQTINLDAA